MTEASAAAVQNPGSRTLPDQCWHDRVAVALQRGRAIRKGSLLVSSGIVGIRMYYTNRQLAERYVASFLPPRKMAETIDITLLSAADADLSLLVPNSPNQGRVYAREDLLVVWAAGERPFLSIYDHRRREGLVWLATAAAPAWELSRPACAILNAAAAAGPWTVCHGAAIGRGGRMLFLAGPGRAGKTTAAIACVHAGWDYAGDDYVLVNS